ncbi:MAG: hypothetical protein ABJN42_22685, partial [Roseibium sp.]|uniref:hypothetical protein n=3 Tax=Roseibium sp. TaxID=1936156 RepID=UPI0032989189
DRSVSIPFDVLVKTAVREGKSGRADIVRHLAELPLEKLRNVPPSALSLIGPKGLAALARRRSDMAGLAPKPQAATTTGSRTTILTPDWTWKPCRLLFVVGLCCGIIAVVMSFDKVVALAGRSYSGDLLPRDAGEWPGCQRLDRLTDGCVYRTGGSSLTLVQAAEYLEIDARDLGRLNRHLNAAGTERLAAGSRIVVLRDPGRISGESQ